MLLTLLITSASSSGSTVIPTPISTTPVLTQGAIGITVLPDKTMHAGCYRDLYFHVYDYGQNAVNLTYQIGYWTLSPYNNLNYIAIVKYGICYNGYFVVNLYSNDTINLVGKYVQQAYLLGTQGYDYGLVRGNITFIPAIRSV